MAGQLRIGKYLAERALGAGSFATVWLGYDELLEVQVAIKVLADNWARNTDVRRRFIEEARLLRRIDHDRVVRVHDVDELEDGRPYFVMALADRGTLLERIERRGGVPMELDVALRLSLEICDALSVVHDFGVVHRDVKPSNILFRSIRSHERVAAKRLGRVVGEDAVMIADFGLAKDLAVASGFTLAGGTPAYMAPEQAFPTAVIDSRADLFAVTAIVYELLAGHPAFHSDTLSGVRRTRSPALVTPLAVRRHDVPPSLAAIVTRGLAADPDDRYDTLYDLRDELADVLDALPVQPEGRGPTTRLVEPPGLQPPSADAAGQDATGLPPAPSFEALPLVGVAGRVRDLITDGAVFTAGDPVVTTALARLERPFTTVVVGAAPRDVGELTAALGSRRDMRVVPVGDAGHPAVGGADLLVVLLRPHDGAGGDTTADELADDVTSRLADVRAVLQRSVAGPYAVEGLVAASDAAAGMAVISAVEARPKVAALLPDVALAGDVALRRLGERAEHLAETRGVAFRAASGLAVVRRALRDGQGGTARSELLGRLDLLRQELPLLAELDALREIVAGRSGLPPALRRQVSRLLIEVDPGARLDLRPDADAAALREAVEALGSSWRVLENTGRIPFNARATMLVAQQVLDRLHLELVR